MTIIHLSSRIPELLRDVDDARQARQNNCARLLADLTPRLQSAREAERERDRHKAPRFNVFRYLRYDELGLSRMIADLLDPAGEHGQGTRFLEAMLAALPETRGRLGGLDTEAVDPIKVVTEHCTTKGRFIDITVDIPTAAGRFCLAFENKPYAGDQPRQVKDYLEYLCVQYGSRFLLVYLPPVHRWPDEGGFPRANRARWRGQFRIMSYTGSNVSLENWFATCRKLCDADRVSWFLRDAQLFCQQRFGESTMTTNPDTRFVRQYLSDNPSQLRAALAVHDGWPLVRAEICERFLEHLRSAVEERLHEERRDIESGLHVRCHYGGEKKYSNRIKITRDGWVRYDDIPANMDGRSAIMLQSEGRGPNSWYWGVTSPKPASKMTEDEGRRRNELALALQHRGLSLAGADDDWWPQWEYLPRHRHWDPLVPELYEECEAGGGRITTFYVDGLLNIARRAIPAINEVEMADRAGSGE